MTQRPLDWMKTKRKLEELSDPSKVMEIVSQNAERVLREEYPDNYEEIRVEHRAEIEEVITKLVAKYRLDLRRKAKYPVSL